MLVPKGAPGLPTETRTVCGPARCAFTLYVPIGPVSMEGGREINACVMHAGMTMLDMRGH